jgi:hypothetical protein
MKIKTNVRVGASGKTTVTTDPAASALPSTSTNTGSGKGGVNSGGVNSTSTIEPGVLSAAQIAYNFAAYSGSGQYAVDQAALLTASSAVQAAYADAMATYGMVSRCAGI